MTLGTLEGLVEHVKERVLEIGGRLEPDADWSPFLFLYNAKGELLIVPVEIPDEQAKQRFFLIIFPAMVVAHRAQHAVFVTTVWMRKASEFERRRGMFRLPSEMSDRVEAVHVMGVTADSAQTWVAEIRRSDKHPELERWQTFGEYLGMDGEEPSATGRVVEPLQQALAAVAAKTKGERR